MSETMTQTVVANGNGPHADDATTCRCRVCGYVWQRRVATPRRCPYCHRPDWLVPPPPRALLHRPEPDDASAKECRKCGHRWWPRVENPAVCPRCMRRDWAAPISTRTAKPRSVPVMPHPYSDRHPSQWDKLVLAAHLDEVGRADEAEWIRKQTPKDVDGLKRGRYLAEWREARRRLFFKVRPSLVDDGSDPHIGKESY